MAMRFMPFAVPTARVAPDWPMRVATSRYDQVSP
jgi:hypothetical protein